MPDASWAEVCNILSAAPDSHGVHEVLAALSPTTNPDLHAELRALLLACKDTVSWKALGLLLSVAGEVVERQDGHKTELIWTGPQGSTHLRRLEQVLYDCIHEARSRILLVTFAAAHIRHLNAALLKALERGVSVRLVLEFELTSEGQLSFDALRAFDRGVQERAKIYFWPAEYRERNALGRTGKLHAKCAVIDKGAIISSANLTDDAFSRNMELGVHIANHTLADDIWAHVEALITRGILQSLR